MAPAANASKNGNNTCIFNTKIAPIIAAIGSTTPLNWPKKKAFLRDNPSLRSGKLTALPSGKFCNPIPKANVKADAKVDPSKLYAKEPKATPTTKPSGLFSLVHYNIHIIFIFYDNIIYNACPQSPLL